MSSWKLAMPIDSERLTAAIQQVPNSTEFTEPIVHCVATLARNSMGKILRQAVHAQVVASLDGDIE